MKKFLKVAMVAALALAIASPALAAIKVNGYYRLMAHQMEYKSYDKNGGSQQFTDQRLRAKVTNSLNENVAIVWYGEVDTMWGSVSRGGDLGADERSVETKNIYLDVKWDDNLIRLGAQTMSDIFQGVVFADDMSGITASTKFGSTKVDAHYAKWEDDDDFWSGKESDEDRDDWNDLDVYGVEVTNKFNDNFSGGAAIYWVDDNTSSSADNDIYYYGLNGFVGFDNLNFDGFIVFQDGTYDYNDSLMTDYDYEGFFASVKGTLKINNGDIGLRLIYVSDADDDNDEGGWTGEYGTYALVKENQMFFMTDPYTMNDGKHRYAMEDAAEDGFGLFAAILSGNHTLPDNMYFKWGAGYYTALEDHAYDDKTVVTSTMAISDGDDFTQGETLGYELCVRVGKKFFEKVDVSINAAYASFGDFYDNTNVDKHDGSLEDPDAVLRSYLMVNVPY